MLKLKIQKLIFLPELQQSHFFFLRWGLKYDAKDLKPPCAGIAIVGPNKKLVFDTFEYVPNLKNQQFTQKTIQTSCWAAIGGGPRGSASGSQERRMSSPMTSPGTSRPTTANALQRGGTLNTIPEKEKRELVEKEGNLQPDISGQITVADEAQEIVEKLDQAHLGGQGGPVRRTTTSSLALRLKALEVVMNEFHQPKLQVIREFANDYATLLIKFYIARIVLDKAHLDKQEAYKKGKDIKKADQNFSMAFDHWVELLETTRSARARVIRESEKLLTEILKDPNVRTYQVEKNEVLTLEESPRHDELAWQDWPDWLVIDSTVKENGVLSSKINPNRMETIISRFRQGRRTEFSDSLIAKIKETDILDRIKGVNDHEMWSIWNRLSESDQRIFACLLQALDQMSARLRDLKTELAASGKTKTEIGKIRSATAKESLFSREIVTLLLDFDGSSIDPNHPAKYTIHDLAVKFFKTTNEFRIAAIGAYIPIENIPKFDPYQIREKSVRENIQNAINTEENLKLRNEWQKKFNEYLSSELKCEIHHILECGEGGQNDEQNALVVSLLYHGYIHAFAQWERVINRNLPGTLANQAPFAKNVILKPSTPSPPSLEVTSEPVDSVVSVRDEVSQLQAFEEVIKTEPLVPDRSKAGHRPFADLIHQGSFLEFTNNSCLDLSFVNEISTGEQSSGRRFSDFVEIGTHDLFTLVLCKQNN